MVSHFVFSALISDSVFPLFYFILNSLIKPTLFNTNKEKHTYTHTDIYIYIYIKHLIPIQIQLYWNVFTNTYMGLFYFYNMIIKTAFVQQRLFFYSPMNCCRLQFPAKGHLQAHFIGNDTAINHNIKLTTQNTSLLLLWLLFNGYYIVYLDSLFVSRSTLLDLFNEPTIFTVLNSRSRYKHFNFSHVLRCFFRAPKKCS